jgi:hypothetical protein
MYFNSSVAIAILALLGQAKSTPTSTLPTVDLGYEIHQALYFDVSVVFAQKQLLTKFSLITNSTISATSASHNHQSVLSAGLHHKNPSPTDRSSKLEISGKSVLNRTQHGISEESNTMQGIPTLVLSAQSS